MSKEEAKIQTVVESYIQKMHSIFQNEAKELFAGMPKDILKSLAADKADKKRAG